MDLRPAHWSLLPAFLAAARLGSLSAAARATGMPQPTLGRQIAALEAALGTDLFRRHPRGLTLTDAGAALFPSAQAMETAAQELALAAAGQTARLQGPVRITASVVVAFLQLPPILARLRQDEPLITLEIVPTDATTNLLAREADIAVRMYRPSQPDLVTRHLGDLTLGVWASETYLARRGQPRQVADLAAHDIIGYDRSSLIDDGFREMGFPGQRPSFACRTDDNLAYYALVRAGCGIGFLQDALGARTPGLVRLDIGLALPSLPLWLTAHAAMRQTPRIRRVWDALAEGLRPGLTPAP